MTTIYVEFTDSTKTAISLVFGIPQDPEQYPNQGSVDSSDAIWKAYYDAQPAFTQQYLTAPTTD